MDRLSGFRTFDTFAGAISAGAFTPLPDGWVVGVTDVVDSTAAIAAGRYKAVNVAGAAAITAVMNALATRCFPFAFMGDGCAFALPGDDAATARTALARTAAWALDDLALDLRTALVGVDALRGEGADVSVALFGPSPHVAYAMFDGGGVALAERGMKDGRFRLAPAANGARPDLSGLSCRWLPVASRNGAMVSLVVTPGPAGAAAFRAAAEALAARLSDARVHPVPPTGPRLALLSPGLRLEALASRGRRPLWRRLPAVALHHAMGCFLFLSRMRAGAFDPPHYRRLTAANADTRKFGDALLLTIDCDAALEASVVALLDEGVAAGAVRYGLHRQGAALMTCLVPSYQDDGHFHFIDGADGGYTAAARALKGQEG